MNQTRAYLTTLAILLADSWAAKTPVGDEKPGGQMRVDTRNTAYFFRAGICTTATRRDGKRRPHTADFVGMRLLGWLLHDDPCAGLQQKWRAGAYAVMWRARRAGDTHSSVALTSATLALTTVRRQPPALAARPSPAAGVQVPLPPYDAPSLGPTDPNPR